MQTHLQGQKDMGWAPTLVTPPDPGDTPQTRGHPCPQLTSHREEEQGRADTRGAAVEALLLVPDAPNHHAQPLGDGETPQKTPSVLCSQHPPGSECHPSHRDKEDTAHQCPRQR